MIVPVLIQYEVLLVRMRKFLALLIFNGFIAVLTSFTLREWRLKFLSVLWKFGTFMLPEKLLWGLSTDLDNIEECSQNVHKKGPILSGDDWLWCNNCNWVTTLLVFYTHHQTWNYLLIASGFQSVFTVHDCFPILSRLSVFNKNFVSLLGIYNSQLVQVHQISEEWRQPSTFP